MPTLRTRPRLLLVTSGATATTKDVYPTVVTHPNAVWTRSGNTLTSTGRHYLPVYTVTDGFVLGTTKPTWANSGCRIPQASLSTYNGSATNHSLITTADNQVISGMYLPDSRIEVRHKNVVIRDCIIKIGYDAGRAHVQNNCAVITTTADTRGLRIEYVTVDPLNAGSGGSADDADVAGFYMSGGGVVYRCALRNVTDGIMPDLYGGGGVDASLHAWGNYIQTRWLPFDPQQSDGTHNDGIQVAGGEGHTVIGNALINPSGGVTDPGSGFIVRGQCMLLDPYHSMVPSQYASISGKDSALSANVDIRWNWLSGAFTQISSYLPYFEGGPGVAGVTIIGNRHSGVCQWPMLLTPATNNTKRALSGNVVDTGGITWNGGTMTAGTAITGSGTGINVATHTDTSNGQSNASTSFAGPDQIVEPGGTCYLLAKGKNASNVWIKTGAWSVVSNDGAAITITSNTGADGATYASFPTPSPTTPQTIVLRWTPTGIAATDDCTITVAPTGSGVVPDPTRVRSAAAATFASSVTVTQTTAAGNTLIAMVGHQSQSGVTMSDTGGNTWTLAATTNGTGATAEKLVSIYYCIGAAATTSVTATGSGATALGLRVTEASDVASVRDTDGVFSGTPSVTIASGDLVVTIVGNFSGTPTQGTAGYTTETEMAVSTTHFNTAYATAVTASPAWTVGFSMGTAVAVFAGA